MTYTVCLEKEENWYSAGIQELNIYTQWNTLDECMIHVQEAMECYFEEEKVYQSNISHINFNLKFMNAAHAFNLQKT